MNADNSLRLSRCGPVLLAVLIPCLAPAAGADSSDSLAGVPPSDPTEWRYHGIEEAEASRWIRQGIIFAAWAAQWRSEGFAPEAAGAWKDIANVYTAGGFLKSGFAPEEARAWMDQGIRSGERARAFLAAGITAGEAASYQAAGFDPEAASRWRRAGFDARAMLDWSYGPRESAFYHTTDCPSSRVVYPLERAIEWRKGGFSAAEAHRASMYGIQFAEASAWKAAGFTFDETVTWRDSGIQVADAARSRDAGLSAVEAELRRYDASNDRGDELARLDVDLTVHADWSIDVVETVLLIDRPGGAYTDGYEMPLPGEARLRSLRSQGFGRPTYSRPEFHLRSVEVDGAPAVHALAGGKLRVRGERPPGDGRPERIRIAYTTSDRILAEPHHDELYFDIVREERTGRHIRAATATVKLPPGAHVIFIEGEAGLDGRKDFVAALEETDGGDLVTYTVSRPLRDEMSFAVDVAFVQGAMDRGKLHGVVQLNRATGGLPASLALFLFGLGLALSWYLAAWHRVGRDPPGRGPAATELAPPDAMGPAMLRALGASSKVDAVSVAAELLHLAELGGIRIDEREGSYTLAAVGVGRARLPDDARQLHTALGTDGKPVPLRRGGSKDLAGAARELQARLRGEQRTRCALNRRWLWPGRIIALLTILACLGILDPRAMDRDARWLIISAFAGFMAAAFGLLGLVFRRLLRSPTVESARLRERIGSYVRFLERSFAGRQLAGLVPPLLRAHLPYAIAGGLDLSGLMIRSGEATWFRGTSGGFACDDFIKAVRTAL